MRLVIDPGPGNLGGGRLGPDDAGHAEWVLQVTRELAHHCEARGATVVATRTDERFVPRIVRRAYAREYDADIVLCLAVGRPIERSVASVRFGFRWWQPGPARLLADHILAALEAAMPMWPFPGRGLGLRACAGSAAPLRALPLLIMIHLPIMPSPGCTVGPEVWASALAQGICSYHLGERRVIHDAVTPTAPEPPMPEQAVAPSTPAAAQVPKGPSHAVLLIPGLRHPLVGEPLLLPRGFTTKLNAMDSIVNGRFRTSTLGHL